MAETSEPPKRAAGAGLAIAGADPAATGADLAAELRRAGLTEVDDSTRRRA
jgi:hypothetical protein